jgi:hypothetical protein
MGAAITLKIMGKKDAALFAGQWTAPFLLFGLCNKLVKPGGYEIDDKMDE